MTGCTSVAEGREGECGASGGEVPTAATSGSFVGVIAALGVTFRCRILRAAALGVALPALGLGCAAGRSFSARIHDDVRSDGATMQWLAKEPTGDGLFAVVLYLDGSGCSSVVHTMPALQALVDSGFGVAAPEKRGVRTGDGGDSCSREYLDTNDRAQRLADADLTVRHLRARFPRWDGRLVVMGASEGAALAPEVAVRHGEATAAVVLMAGGGWDQATELKALAVKAGESTEPLERQFESMEANPVSTLSWRGEDNTYRRWASYLRYRPLDFLVRVAAPVYVVHGARDDSTPIQSSEAIAEEYRRLGRDSLTFRSWPDLDHRWNAPDGTNHLIDVGGEVIGWLVVQVPRR